MRSICGEFLKFMNERVSGILDQCYQFFCKYKGRIFAVSFMCIFIISIWVRFMAVDFHREISLGGGDEAAYHYAAENLLKYGVFTIDRDGSVYQGINQPEPSSALQIGYPLVIALLYTLFGHETRVIFVFQFILSMMDLLLIAAIMYICNCRKWTVCFVTLLAGIYPGFIYNIDKMLTEQLFKTLLLIFAAAFLYALNTKHGRSKMIMYMISALVLGFAVFTRGLAFPFLFLALYMIYFYESMHRTKNLALYAVTFSVTQIWWWIRNGILFNRLILLSDAGVGPKIWGMMPYYLDMTSSAGKTAEELCHLNLEISLPLFFRWKIFGTINYLWSDIWDEGVVHSPFRELLWIHIILLITVLLYPRLARRCSENILFITSFPIAFTMMNLPYHGLPRYLYPSVSFIFIALGMLLSNHSSVKRENVGKKEKIKIILEKCYFGGTVLFSAVLFLSLMFGYCFNIEMSDWRLHKYLDTSVYAADQGEVILNQEYFEDDVVIENSSKNGSFYENCIDAPSFIKLNCQTVQEKVATKVSINMQGGYLFDYMIVYWKNPDMETMDEDHVYCFPINIFQKKHSVYLDGDADSLMIIPMRFRGGRFQFDSITVEKIKY